MSCDECANFKPKRKQTGWICRECGRTTDGKCVRDSGPRGPSAAPERCLYNLDKDARWEPFYGKVDE